MVKQELLDEKLVLEQTLQYKLSIQVSLNGFSFCCLDDRTKRFVAVKDYTFTNISNSYEELVFNLKNILNEDELLKKRYKEVRCMLVNNEYTLIPTTLFEKDHKSTYINQLTALTPGEIEVFAYHLNEKSITAVFVVPKILLSFISEFAQNATYYNQSIPQITKQYSEQNTVTAQLSLFLTENLACYSLMQNNSLKINTTFSFESTNDLVYYTMLLLKEHELTPEKVEIYLSGTVEKQSPRYVEMSNFFPNLAMESVPKGFEYSYKFKHKAEHQFAYLFKLGECV